MVALAPKQPVYFLWAALSGNKLFSIDQFLFWPKKRILFTVYLKHWIFLPRCSTTHRYPQMLAVNVISPLFFPCSLRTINKRKNEWNCQRILRLKKKNSEKVGAKNFKFFNLKEGAWGQNISQITWVKQSAYFWWMKYATKNPIQLYLKFSI